MWTKELKKTAIELANSKGSNESVVNSFKMYKLSFEQKHALAASYANAPSAEQRKVDTDSYWA